MRAGRTWFGLGASLAGLGVAAGAFGAHALRNRLGPADLATFETAARYQMYHALALLAVGLLLSQRESRAARTAGRLFLVGIVLFSGSLYGLTVGGARWLGAVTPIGGVAFLAGWIGLAVAAWQAPEPD